MTDHNTDQNNEDNSGVFIALPKAQFDDLINGLRGATKEEIEEVLAERGNLTENEIKAIKKAVHEETRSAKADFIAEKRKAFQKWGHASSPVYWLKERVPNYNLTNFLFTGVFMTAVASIATSVTANYFTDKMKHTELGEILAASPETTINSGTYSPEIGQGPYVFIGNALSKGLADQGASGYGYNNPGGAKYNYFTLAEDGNEMHLSLVEPVVVDQYKNSSPSKSSPDTKMGDYALLVKKIDIQECAWSASPVYTDYADIMNDLEDGKDLRISWQWNGTGSDYARMTVYTTLFNKYADQIKLVPTKDNVDMLQKLESKDVDLAIFTEAAGTFDGAVTGTLRKAINIDSVNLVNFTPDVIPTVEGEEAVSLSYTFKTLSVPSSLTQWGSAPTASKPIGTMCNEYIGLYGRNPTSIDSVSKAMAAERTQNLARDVDIVEATKFKAFPAR
ncbi:MAG: hypothetical protein CL561_10775 [Alphaproteobacteria bacterium]|nr:hypothetical protein [Alphaproteobacteria bacterium]|tara:strand:+ start:241796 stop:243139 length:1344 start_codon:yes stop_codon:yes gene_type:complete